MNDASKETNPPTFQLVPEDQRLDFIEKEMGVYFPLIFECFVYRLTQKMTRGQYSGGYWDFCRMDNAWFMAPAGNECYQVESANGWSGALSAEALGIVVSLTAFSNLSFSEYDDFARLCARGYHRLRPLIYDHPAAAAILAATD